MPPSVFSYQPAAARRMRKLVLLCATILIIAFMTLVHTVFPPAAHPVNAQTVPAPASYTAKTLDYQLAVYLKGQETPAFITDIDVRTLPEADRAALSTGIVLDSDEALAHLLEDYSS